MSVAVFAPGGYRYIKGMFQYSGGSAAEPGFEIVRARFPRALPLVAGSGEAPEGKPNYRDYVVRPNDVSVDGLREKIRFVMAEMRRRLVALGFGWQDAGSTQAYTVRDIGALVEPEIVARGAARNGLSWHFCRPPVAGMDYEMDVRATAQELLL